MNEWERALHRQTIEPPIKLSQKADANHLIG